MLSILVNYFISKPIPLFVRHPLPLYNLLAKLQKKSHICKYIQNFCSIIYILKPVGHIFIVLSAIFNSLKHFPKLFVGILCFYNRLRIILDKPRLEIIVAFRDKNLTNQFLSTSFSNGNSFRSCSNSRRLSRCSSSRSAI